MIDYLKDLAEFVTSGIYQFFVDFLAYVVTAFTWMSIEASLATLSLAWDISKSIYDLLNIQSILEQFLDSISSEMYNAAASLRLFDALNLIINAHITRYVMSLIGK